jgi:hypothetical protein
VCLTATLNWGRAQAQSDGPVLRVEPTLRMGGDRAQADVEVPLDQSGEAKDAVQVSGETHFNEAVLEPVPILGSKFAGSWGAVTVEFQTPLGERSQPEEAEIKRQEAQLAALQSFEGRILRGIQLAGLAMSARAFVEQALTNVRIALPDASITCVHIPH